MRTLSQLLEGIKDVNLTGQSHRNLKANWRFRARVALSMLVLLTSLFNLSGAATFVAARGETVFSAGQTAANILQDGTPEPGAPSAGDTAPATSAPAAQSAAGYKYYLPSIARMRLNVTGSDWPMAAANPARTSASAEEVPGDLKPVWFKHFDAYISQKVQIIAAENSLFISTAAGLYALDAASGNERWFYPTRLPLGHSPTISNGIAYVGGHDKKIHAVNTQNGQGLWTFQAGAGFSTNPLVVEGKVFAGNRDGTFYAIYSDGAKAGQLAWKFATEGPILYSAAYKDGVLYFASNDNHAYALRAQDGQLVWKSAKLPGHGFHSWWPVVYGNYVVFAGSYNYRDHEPFIGVHIDLDREQAYPPGSNQGDPIGPEGTEQGNWINGTKTINATAISQYFENYPHRRTVLVLNRPDGQEYTYDSDGDGKPEYAPVLWFGTHAGTRYPPVLGPDNVLYQSNNLYYDPFIPRGSISGWKFGTPIVSVPDGSETAVDEPLAYSMGGNIIYWKRCCDRMAGALEFYKPSGSAGDLNHWTYFDEGGKLLRRTLPELYQKGWNFAYWKHGDQSPPIPYQGRVYTFVNNAVVAFAPNGLNPVLPNNPQQGSVTGEKASDVEREQVIPGVNTKVTLGNNQWPLLLQQEIYYLHDDHPNSRGRYFRLFEVAASGSSPGSLNVQDKGISTLLTSTSGSEILRTWVSRRAPATLFETNSSVYLLNGSLVGMAFPGGSGVQVRSGSATISGAELSAGWLLVWDSTTGHRWSPMVISLQRRPAQIAFSSGGLQISFSGPAGYLAITPLHGMSAPLSNEINTWPGGVPAETIQRVQLLDRIARAFPESATENWSIDSGSGDASFSYAYSNIEFPGDWGTPPLRMALVPSHTALAAWNGSPIQINGKPLEQQLDLDYVTPLGRVAGVPDSTSVSVRLPGIANTWLRDNTTGAAPTAADPLHARLVAEIQKILEAGHLLPAYGKIGILDNKLNDRLGDDMADYWKNPADTVYTLLRALPLLPAGMQPQVKTYLQNEFQNYPLYNTAHVGWKNGTKRDWFDWPPEVISAAAEIGPSSRTNFNSWGLPPFNLYALAMYAKEFGNASELFNQSKDKSDMNPQYEYSMPYVLNSYIAGYIGYLRLANMAGAGQQASVEKTLLDALVLRAALSKFPDALERVGFEYGGRTWSVRRFAPDRADTIFDVNATGNLWNQLSLYGYPVDPLSGMQGPNLGGGYSFGIDFVNLVPELARFLRDYARAESQAMVDSYTRRAPYWFVGKAEETGGEGVFQPLHDRWSFFQAKAQILQQNRGELEQYLDVSMVRVGDLYYIQNLVAALLAR